MYIRLKPEHLPAEEKQKWITIRYLDWMQKLPADKIMYEVKFQPAPTAAQKLALSLGHIKRHGSATGAQASLALKALRELEKVIDQAHVPPTELRLCISKMCDAYNSARSAMIHWELGIKRAKEAKQKELAKLNKKS